MTPHAHGGEDAPSVAVILSTYNGAAYLEDQLESVLSQDMPCVSIFVRDDGSTDGSLDMLRRYADAGRLTLLSGENIGVTRSFFDLLARVADDYDYVAFCDQDDVWHPDKLSRAVSVLSTCDPATPQLYAAEFVYCDQDAHPKSTSRLNRIGAKFETTLYENIASGNTQVLNQTLARLIAEAGPEGVYYHDWWVALVASALGEVHFDDYACLDYRRTGGNVSPSGLDALRLAVFRIRTFIKGGDLRRISTQLERLRELYGSTLPASRRDVLSCFLDRGRLAKALAPFRLRQRLPDELALRISFLLGLL